MATIEIRDILDNETGETIFPRTHVDAVIGLQDSSFFEAVQDTQDPTKFSVKLKSEYTGLWAEGFVSAGGVGSQSSGGGGLISSVKGVADLGTPIATESLTETFSAKAIETIWEAVLDLQQGSNVSLVNGASYSTLTVNGTSANFYTKTQVDTLVGSIEQFHYEIYASTSTVTNPQGNVLYLIGPTGSGADKYEEYVYANNSWTKIGDTTIDLSNYALKTGSPFYNFQVNSLALAGGTLTGPLTVDLRRLVYTYTIAGASVDDPAVTVQKTVAYLDDIPTHQTVTLTGGTNNGTLKLTTAAGTVDNIAVTGLQALAYKASLVAADIPDISETYVTISGTQTITGSKTFSTDIITGSDIVPSADLGSSLGYSTRRFSNVNAQTIGASTLNLKNSSSGNSGMLSANGGYLVVRAGSDVTTTGSFKQLVLHETYGFYPDTTGVNLGYSGANNRWANIYGVNADLTGNLVLASTSHIDLGPARIEYDATTGAIHVTTNQTGNNAPTIGFYADGFIAAGGVGANDGGGGYGVESITSNQDGTVDFHFTGGDITTVDLNHTHDGLLPDVDSSNNGKIMKVVNGEWALADESGGGGGGSGYEVTSNKVTSVSSSSTDTQYPSAKCVYDIVGDVETLLAAL